MNKKSTDFGVGTASIINIFLILCLTTFALLSFNSSNQSLKYAQKAVDFDNFYAQAELDANKKLAEIDNIIFSAINSIDYQGELSKLSTLEYATVEKNSNGYTLSYSSKDYNNCAFSVRLQIPLSPSKERFEIIKWATTSTNHDFSQGGIEIWDGF